MGLVFIFIFLINSWLPLSKQTATDSSSNSSQKREQPTRTISSPTACEPRRIYTLGHLHDSYSTDHYHLEQVSGSLLPLLKPRPLLFYFVPSHIRGGGGGSPLLRVFCVPDTLLNPCALSHLILSNCHTGQVLGPVYR